MNSKMGFASLYPSYTHYWRTNTMRDPKTVPKIPLYLRLSKSLTYLCFSVILFSTSAVTWAQDLEGSIPNENGDYCVITGPPVLPNGVAERLKLFIQ